MYILHRFYKPVSSFISSIYSIPTSKTSVSPVVIGVTAGGRVLLSVVLIVTTGETFSSTFGATVPNFPAITKFYN